MSRPVTSKIDFEHQLVHFLKKKAKKKGYAHAAERIADLFYKDSRVTLAVMDKLIANKSKVETTSTISPETLEGMKDLARLLGNIPTPSVVTAHSSDSNGNIPSYGTRVEEG